MTEDLNSNGSEPQDAPEKHFEERNGGPRFSFDDLPEALKENVKSLGWKTPLTVQEKVIPILLGKKDVVVQSRTGSGKTAAFVLPLCLEVDKSRDEAQALVLVPTRELAEQVHQVVKELNRNLGIRSVAVYGGVGYGPQIEAFEKNVHVIVATPGRMIDHLKSKRVSLSNLRFLVLDEADEMLSMGFYPSITKILSFLPKRRRTALFSATLPPGVVRLSERFTREPKHVSLSSDIMHVEEVDHTYYVTDAMYKDRALLKIIEMENPEAALIFCNTKREVEYLGVFLRNFGYDGDFLSGDLSQKERDKVMKRIRSGKLRFLVATDVAARGIDISDLGYVILYNLPQAHDHYIHRAGRTGRAGEGGVAISLVSQLEEVELEKRAKRHGLVLIRKELPTDEELEERVAARLLVMLEEKYRGLDHLDRERLCRFIPLAKNVSERNESTEVLAMLFDRFYQETLHKPLYLRNDEHDAEKSGSSSGGQRTQDRGRGGDRNGRRDSRRDGRGDSRKGGRRRRR